MMSPFSKRAVYPWAAKYLAQGTGLELGTSFMLLNVTALAILALCIAMILEMAIGRAWLRFPCY